MYRNKNDPIYAPPDTNYPTRFGSNIRPAFNRLIITQHSISFIGPKIWLSLPIEIRNSPKIHIFKKLLKAHLLSQYIE